MEIVAGFRVIAAIASVSTAVIALWIYWEARRIRRIEWVHKINGQWNTFNSFVVSSGSASLFEDFVKGDAISGREEAQAKTVIFSYLNIVYTVALARRLNLVDGEFSEKMLQDHYAILRRQRKFVEPLLIDRGYANFFREELFTKKGK